MAQDRIVAGSVVKLKSGGPAMTVSWVEDEQAYCAWFVKDEQKGGQFPFTSLRIDGPPMP